jgi:glyoxylase-like metal-dependent hydrolase (beta-lactamase superfamily II)/rhodanese-related sulfurtransferase
MYFQQFYLSCLSHASYMLGSEGVAVVVDPQRDVDIYLEEAERQNLKIQHVVETHLHADFVSGHKELAERTGATIHMGAATETEFPHNSVKDGDKVTFGQCVMRFLETPGHTPESICVLVTDPERSPGPWAVLTGDTLFIGEVGRPDLVPGHTPQEMAGQLYDSLHKKLLSLPDIVEVYPAHGAGSLCGANISSERSSTIGEQKKTNYAVKPMTREEFVQMLTTEIPLRPDFFLRDAELNRAGAPALADLPTLEVLTPKDVQSRQDNGAVVLDTRPPAQFGAGHVPGAINIPLSGQFATWAGTILGLDTSVLLVAEDNDRVEESRLRLARVGIEKVAGYLDGGMDTWEQAGFQTGTVQPISVEELHKLITDSSESLQIVDVRAPGEWANGHIENAKHHPLDRLLSPAVPAAQADALTDIDVSKPVAVHCQGGYRSSIATGLLVRAGFKQVINVAGGFDAWAKQGFPSQAE